MRIPPQYHRLVDDAAIFPPGSMPLPEAVVFHVAHLASEYADLVGPFILGADDVPRAADLVRAEGLSEPLRVSVVVPGPGDVRPVLRAASDVIDLAGLEVKLRPDVPLGEQVEQVAREASVSGVTVYVEAPRPDHQEWPAVLGSAASLGLRLKFRTGGTEAAAFPSDAEVTRWIHQAVLAGVPFKCTAGLHHAIRHTAADTGFEHHGYLNILLACDRALGGASVPEVLTAVADRDPVAVSAAIAALDPQRLARARDSFVSYGSCSVREPLEDLAELGLIGAR